MMNKIKKMLGMRVGYVNLTKDEKDVKCKVYQDDVHLNTWRYNSP